MFIERLKSARKAAGLSQSAIAKKLFISQQAYAKYETGVSSPNPETLAKISSILNVSPDFLLVCDDEDIKKEAAALSDDDLNSEIIKLLTALFPGREEFTLKTLQTLAEIPESQQELALGMLQVLKDHEA